jgi:hypothetical protein
MPQTPTVTLTNYKLNSVVQPTIDVVSEGKTIHNIVIPIMEKTRTIVPTHQFNWSVNPNDGDELFYLKPIVYSNANITTVSRYLGIENGNVVLYSWSNGITAISQDFKVDSGFEGGGESKTYTVSPNGTLTWSPPFGTAGSAVLDIPTVYNGSFVAHIDPATRLDDSSMFSYKLIQLHSQPSVEPYSWINITSVTMVNDSITIVYSGSGILNIQFKIYHTLSIFWEIVELSLNGTITHTNNTWKTISFALESPVDATYTLKLYASSGVSNISYPNILRTITIYVDA